MDRKKLIYYLFKLNGDYLPNVVASVDFFWMGVQVKYS